MKKGILLAICVVFGLVASFAQSDAENTNSVKFGVTGGLLNVNADIDVSALGFPITSIDAINKTGFYIGGFADIPVSEKFHVQPELTYGGSGDLGFVFLPVIAKYYVAEGFNIQAGPQLSFSTNIDEWKKKINKVLPNINVNDYIKTTALDLAFGAGYEITDQLFVNARYVLELTDRLKENKIPIVGGALESIATAKVNSSMLFVGIGYSF